jgi:hypothetical protein
MYNNAEQLFSTFLVYAHAFEHLLSTRPIDWLAESFLFASSSSSSLNIVVEKGEKGRINANKTKELVDDKPFSLFKLLLSLDEHFRLLNMFSRRVEVERKEIALRYLFKLFDQ